jgi:hypothetical protein
MQTNKLQLLIFLRRGNKLIATKLQAGFSGVWFPSQAREFSFPQKPPDRPSNSPCLPSFARRYSDQGMDLAVYLHLVSKLRISGTIFLLSLHALMAWAAKTFTIILIER